MVKKCPKTPKVEFHLKWVLFRNKEENEILIPAIFAKMTNVGKSGHRLCVHHLSDQSLHKSEPRLRGALCLRGLLIT